MDLVLDHVYPGDCRKWLEQVDEASVNLAFADPPFNIGYNYDVYNDRRATDDYLAWSRHWIEGVVRVLRPDGSFWLAIGDEYAAELKVLCARDLGLHLRSWVIWFYTFGVHCTQKFTRSHTHLLYFVKDPKRFTFNSLEVRVPSAREMVYGDKRADPNGRVPDDTWMMTPVIPRDVPTHGGFVLRPQDIPDRFRPGSDTWYFSRVAGTFAERRGWHGCQMPEQLLGRIIRACSNEGDVVLDPFAGSGTTPAVAKKLRRRFLAFELSKKYVRSIDERLTGIESGDPLVGPVNPATSAPRTEAGRQLLRAAQRTSRAVSHSPILTKVNLSLGQVAVANAEYATAVAEAFMAAHQGYSADRVLADPALNDTFLDNCRSLGIPGQPRDWNHLLLNIRKRGGLTAIDTSRRTSKSRAGMDPYIFASEIAWRKLSQEYHCSLDEILCDPTLVSKFDSISKNIAPGFASFEYRWAALSLRKYAAEGDELLDRVTGFLAPRVFSLAETSRLPSAPGHYLIIAGTIPFFVGFAESLALCSLFRRDCLWAALECTSQAVKTDTEIAIRTRKFDFDAMKRVYNGGSAVEWSAAQRAKLVRKYEPVGNIPRAA